MATRKDSTRARRVFAKNMKEKRLDQGLSQEALAERVGLHRTYIGSVERGERNVSIDNMEKIAEALKVDLCDLVRA